MSEIPDDIMRTAEETLDTLLCNVPEAGDVRQGSIMDIARALMAERERCIQIALERTAQVPSQNDFTRGYTEGRLAAAAAIRQDRNGS